MKTILIALFCGVLFGAGLVVSDMINPGRVLAFLDVTGDWDSSLAWVMGGALIPSALAYRLRGRLDTPIFADRFHLSDRSAIEPRLLLGAAAFGVGWGLVGLCPGPAIAALTTGRWQVLLFVVAMLGGMALFRLVHERPARMHRS